MDPTAPESTCEAQSLMAPSMTSPTDSIASVDTDRKAIHLTQPHHSNTSNRHTCYASRLPDPWTPKSWSALVSTQPIRPLNTYRGLAQLCSQSQTTSRTHRLSFSPTPRCRSLASTAAFASDNRCHTSSGRPVKRWGSYE